MKLLNLISLAVLLLASATIYLASPHQRWLAARWPALPARSAGMLLLLLGWLGMARGMQPLAATFVSVTALMLAFCAWPYLGALRAIRRGS